ncbi:MAG: hypothetical protein HY761_04860 [Candidatus Omnitrophica bacterium]|nr:hypothetical protein [Candidatus Omnitrophota bacterium]
MNLTDKNRPDDENEEAAGRFFREKIVCGINNMGNKWFPLKPEPDEVSYFNQCKQSSLTRQDFELPHYETPEQLQSVLIMFWQERGDSDIASYAEGLARLGWKLHSTKQGAEDIPPYIYVMF